MITLLILASVLCSSLAQIFLKLGMNRVDGEAISIPEFLFRSVMVLEVAVGVALQMLALALWLFALKRVDVSYAYPFVALGFVVVLVISAIFMHETISLYRGVGVGLIVAGILFVAHS